MSQVLKMSRKAFSATVVAATIAWSVGLSALVAPLAASAAVAPGSLVKASLPAVYYVGADNKRYVFPNERTYKTWYADFSAVQTITDAELAALPIGGNVTYKPGVKMVKITTDPKVYAVGKNGELRHVSSEALAVSLYGADWNKKIDDVADAFFVNYRLGADVVTASDFSPSAQTASATSINDDKSLGGTVAGNLGVSLSSSNPASSSIIADTNGAQARVDALRLTLTSAMGTTATVTGLKLKRMGISSDSDIDNVYLYDGATLLAEMTSLSAGVVTFSGLSLAVTGSKDLSVKLDLNRNATSGKSLGLSVNAGADVTLSGGGSASGSFPVSGNLHTVALVTDLGHVTLALGAATSTTVDAGTANFEAMTFTLQANDQDATLSSVKLKMTGSINSGDLADFKLYDGATQIGSTVAALDADKNVTFDLSASPLKISSGVTKTLRVKVMVKSGSSRNIILTVQKPYDVKLMDAQYNVSINPDNGTAGTFGVITSTTATVASGSMTVTLSTASPSGNVALDATNVLLAKFDLKALGEAMKFSSLDINVSNGTAGWTNMRNVRLVLDGSQIGTTQATVTADEDTTVTVNFTIAAGVTSALEIRGDITSSSGTDIANTNQIIATLDLGQTDNVQRQNSLTTLTVPTADVAANTLTAAVGALTVAVNPSLGAQSYVEGTPNVRLTSHLLTAGSSEGVDVTSVVFDDIDGGAGNAAANALGDAFANLTLKMGGTQIAAVVSPGGSDAADTNYTFSLSPAVSIPAGTTVQFDLYGDVLTGTAAGTTRWEDLDRVRMVSSTGTGKVTTSTVNGTANVNGQQISIVTSGTLSLATDSSSPIATQFAMGSTDKTLGVFKFSANNIEALTISQITVTNENAAGSGEFKNLKLYVGGVQVGSSVPAFNGSNEANFVGMSINVPRAGQTLVTVKGDLVAYEDGAVSNDFATISLDLETPITGVAGDNVIARGASGSFATVAATDADAASLYPFRTTLAASIACSGSCSGRTRATSDIVGKLTLTGGSSNVDAQLRAAMQYNDDTDGATAGSNDWQAPTGTANANAVAADTAISVDGASLSWSATTDFEDEDILVMDLPATTDLSGFSRVSFWLWTTSATTSGDDFTFFTSATATQTGAQETLVTTATAAGTWTYIDVVMPVDTVATDDFAGLTMEGSELGSSDVVKIDEVRFYNDKINVDVSGNLCDTDANCAAEDGGTNNTPVGVPLTLRDSGGTTRGVGYYTGTATTGTATIFLGADVGAPAGAQTATTLTPAAGTLGLGTAAQVFDLVANTSELVDSDSTATEVLSLSLDLGTSSSAGDFLWFDQGPAAATTNINWMNGTSPVSVSMGY